MEKIITAFLLRPNLAEYSPLMSACVFAQSIWTSLTSFDLPYSRYVYSKKPIHAEFICVYRTCVRASGSLITDAVSCHAVIHVFAFTLDGRGKSFQRPNS